MNTTTQQMLNAPEGAVYVWCNDALDYPRDLAKHLGRKDLIIIPPHGEDAWTKTAGTTRAVVIDHAVLFHRLSVRDAEMLLYAENRGTSRA